MASGGGGGGGISGDAAVVAYLRNCVSEASDQQQRSAAEAALRQASSVPGYGLCLTQIAFRQPNTEGSDVRQLAAVLLRQHIKRCWAPEASTSTSTSTSASTSASASNNTIESKPPTPVSDDEKAAIRYDLLVGLGDTDHKLRNGAAAAIACIAAFEWPDKWADLVDRLLEDIANTSQPVRVAGAVTCLAQFTDEMDDKQVPALVPKLFPALLAVVSNPQVYGGDVRKGALQVAHACIAMLGVMSGVYQKETNELLAPMLPAWLSQFVPILSSPVSATDATDWAVWMEVFRFLTIVIQHFPTLVQPHMPGVLAALWQGFVASIPAYEEVAVRGVLPTSVPAAATSTGSAAVASDAPDCKIESVAVQAFEFLLSLINRPQYQESVASTTEALVYFAIAYMQMTKDQEETWGNDANAFVADEDDDAVSCRTSACLLLEELVDTFAEVALRGISTAVQRRLLDATAALQQGSSTWWKMREAAVLCAGTVADEFMSTEVSGGEKLFDVNAFVDMLLQHDLGPGGANSEELQFLYSRCLWACARFCPVAGPERQATLLRVAVASLDPARPMVVRVGACRALARAIPNSPSDALAQSLPAVYSGIGSLLPQTSEETLHVALEVLETAVRSGKEVAAAMEPAVSPALLDIWADNVNDPVISSDASDVLEALADSPHCIASLANTAFPRLHAILSQPAEQPEGLVAGAMELLTMLLKRCPPETVRPAFDSLFGPLSAVVLAAEDHTELQNGAEALAALVKCGGENLPQWSSDPAATVKGLLDCAAKLLSPQLEPSASLFVGPFLEQLLRRLPTHVAPHLQPLVAAVVARMASKPMPSLTTSLLLVLARLIHLCGSDGRRQLVEILATLPPVQQQQYGGDSDGSASLTPETPALQFVLEQWSVHHSDIRGKLKTKVATSALALLLASGDPRLSSVTVPGRLVVPAGGDATSTSGGGPVTRARALRDKKSRASWTQVPFPTKALELIAEALIETDKVEAQRRKLRGESSGSDDCAGGSIVAGRGEAGAEGEEYAEDARRALAAASKQVDALAASFGGGNDDDDDDDDYDVEDDDDDDVDEDDDDYDENGGVEGANNLDDPLPEVTLERFLRDFVQSYASLHGPTFQTAAQDLSEDQKRALHSRLG